MSILFDQQFLSRFRINRTFSALRHRNYRLWFSGQIISLFGTWMQNTALGFLVYELTQSPVWLGYVGFATGIPVWLFMLWGGVVADRVPKRSLLITTQLTMMILAVILTGLTFSELIQPWHIIVLAFASGIANAFDAPARHAFVIEMVGKTDLTNAIALNSTLFHSAATIGPAAAGLIYAFYGPAWCFAVNAVSFLAVIIALFLMKLPVAEGFRQNSRINHLCEGLRYVATFPALRMLILTMIVFSLFGMSFATLLPAWAVEILNGNARTNGYLRSAQGLGSLLGALSIAALSHRRIRGQMLSIGLLSFPLCLLIFTAVRSIPMSLLIIAFLGGALIFITNLENALIQDLVSDDLRGRVMSIYSLSFFGFMPVGALVAGQVADLIREPLTVVGGALAMLLFALLSRRLIRTMQ